ncbi:MAG TPA: DRTGG domain-containing protein [Vicinamibacterales bacterium]|nr:DRTGG domain-containing protein [Vicinamibacterales bacterium]
MTLGEIVRLLDCTVITGDDLLETEVEACFAADLMSDVLAFSRAGALMVTGLASIQSVHAADVADLRAILFVHDKRPEPPVVEAARGKGLPLLTTPRLMFETCGLLFGLGLKAAGKEEPRGLRPAL